MLEIGLEWKMDAGETNPMSVRRRVGQGSVRRADFGSSAEETKEPPSSYEEFAAAVDNDSTPVAPEAPGRARAIDDRSHDNWSVCCDTVTLTNVVRNLVAVRIK